MAVVMIMILWLSELAHDFEVLGSIPATSEGFSRAAWEGKMPFFDLGAPLKPQEWCELNLGGSVRNKTVSSVSRSQHAMVLIKIINYR